MCNKEVYITEYRGFPIFYDEEEREFYVKWCASMSANQYAHTFDRLKEIIKGMITAKRFHRATQTLLNIIKYKLDKQVIDYTELEMYRNSAYVTCIRFKLGKYRWQEMKIKEIVSMFNKMTSLDISLDSFCIIETNKLYMWWGLDSYDVECLSNIDNALTGDELTGKLVGIYDDSTDGLWWDNHPELLE